MRCSNCKVMLDSTTGRALDYENDAVLCHPCYDMEHGITERFVTADGINRLFGINSSNVHPLFERILNTTLGGK